MMITDVRIRMVKKEDSKLKAVASITIDDEFAVRATSLEAVLQRPFEIVHSSKVRVFRLV